MNEPPIYWGGCAVCGRWVDSDGMIVWTANGRLGYFACLAHVAAVRARNRSSTVETLKDVV